MKSSKFTLGQLVHHKLFDYRGVVVDVDAVFSLTEEWYEAVARSRPPRDEPWYRVLVHGAEHETYVAEQNLEPDSSAAAIDHPQVRDHFDRLQDGQYVRDRALN